MWSVGGNGVVLFQFTRTMPQGRSGFLMQNASTLLVRVNKHTIESTRIHSNKKIKQEQEREGREETVAAAWRCQILRYEWSKWGYSSHCSRQLNSRKEWGDRLGGEDWGECYCEHLQVMAESGCWVSLWNNQNWHPWWCAAGEGNLPSRAAELSILIILGNEHRARDQPTTLQNTSPNDELKESDKSHCLTYAYCNHSGVLAHFCWTVSQTLSWWLAEDWSYFFCQSVF